MFCNIIQLSLLVGWQREEVIHLYYEVCDAKVIFKSLQIFDEFFLCCLTLYLFVISDESLNSIERI
jgi:hypothetical protein